MTNQAQGDLFEASPPDYFGLFNASGTANAKKIAQLLNYRRQDISIAADTPLSRVRLEPNKIPRELLERVAEWGLALNSVGNFFKDVKRTVLWFQTPNPMLGNISPREMIRMGRFKKLWIFIQTALEENNPE